MALNFNPPGFVQPRQYQNPTQTLDTIFNQALQVKVMDQEMKQRQQEMDLQRSQALLQGASTGINPFELAQHPEAIQEGLGAYQAQQRPTNQAFQGMGGGLGGGPSGPLGQPGTMRGPMDLNTAQPSISSLGQAIQSHISRTRAMQSLTGRKEEAEIGKLGAETEKLRAETGGLSGPNNKEIIQGEDDLRKELGGETKIFEIAKDSYSGLRQAVQSGRKGKANDMAIITNYFHVLSPGARIRADGVVEGIEMGSLPSQIRTKVQNVIDGSGDLSDDDKHNILLEAHDQYDKRAESYRQKEGRYKEITERRGLNWGNVQIPIEVSESQPTQGTKQPSKASKVSQSSPVVTKTLRDGTQVRVQRSVNGKWVEVK